MKRYVAFVLIFLGLTLIFTGCEDQSYGDNEQINITLPVSTTVWHQGEVGVEIQWNDAEGESVTIDLWKEEEFIQTLQGSVLNNGNSIVPEPLDIPVHGSGFMIKIRDEFNNYGWSAPFNIEPNAETITVTQSETWFPGQENTTVTWTGAAGEQVDIMMYRGGNIVGPYAASVPNNEGIENTYTRTEPIPSFWGTGDEFRIRIQEKSGDFNFGWSPVFPIEYNMDMIEITNPTSTTVWWNDQLDVEVAWTGALGSQVRFDLLKDQEPVDLFFSEYGNFVPNTGSAIRHYPVFEHWGAGDDFHLKITDEYGNVAYSDPFTIEHGDNLVMVTQPAENATWWRHQTNREVSWEGATGDEVNIFLYRANRFVGQMVVPTANDGSFIYPQPFPIEWGTGYSHIKVVDTSNNYGWSENFNFYYLPIREFVYYSMDEGSSGGEYTIYDDTGGGNDAIAHNVLATANRLGQAALAKSFNGSDAVIDCGNNGLYWDERDSLSISMWVRTTQTGDAVLMGKTRFETFPDSVVLHPSWSLYLNNDGTAGFQLLETEELVNSGTAVNDGAWHHLAVAFDISTTDIRFYLDGLMTDTAVADTRPISNPAPYNVAIGAEYQSELEFTRYYEGEMDDIRVYWYAISNEGVQALYHEASYME